MWVENGHQHIQISVRTYVRRKIYLPAEREIILALIEFGNVERRFPVKNYLRTTYRECQDAERPVAFQSPEVTHIRA